MKKILILVTTCALAVQAQGQQTKPAQQSASFYQKGQEAEKSGDPAAAKDAYTQALKADPGNANARYALGQLRITGPALAAKGREQKFGSVMVPLYQLDNATLKEALDALSIMVGKQSKEEVTPNFVIDDPKSQLAEQKISMNLKNMPARGIIKYLTDQTGTKVRYDEHAIVISPK